MAKQWYKEKKLKQLNIQINMELIKQSKNLILTILKLFDDEVNLKNNGEYGLEWGNGNLNAYPDLIITQSDDSEIYVEFERTQKSPSRFKKKLDEHTKWLRKGGQIYWITPTQTLANWIQRQIDKDDYFKTEKQQVIIWNTQ